MSLDDFEAYAGRVLDHEWRYMGQAAVLAVINSKHDAAKLVGPMSSTPDDRWEVRQAYVVENIPKWDKHPYQRRVLFRALENTMPKWVASLAIDVKNRTNSIFRSSGPADYGAVRATALRRRFDVSNLTEGR